MVLSKIVGWAERSDAHADSRAANAWARRFAPSPTLRRQRSRPIYLSNSRAKSSAASVGPAAGRRVSRLAGGFLVPSVSRGGGAPIGASVISVHACGVSPPTCASPSFLGRDAAPLGAPHGVGRPSGRSPFAGAVPALGLVVAGIGSERVAWGRSAPGRSPCRSGPVLARHEGAGAAPRSAFRCLRSALE